MGSSLRLRPIIRMLQLAASKVFGFGSLDSAFGGAAMCSRPADGSRAHHETAQAHSREPEGYEETFHGDSWRSAPVETSACVLPPNTHTHSIDQMHIRITDKHRSRTHLHVIDTRVDIAIKQVVWEVVVVSSCGSCSSLWRYKCRDVARVRTERSSRKYLAHNILDQIASRLSPVVPTSPATFKLY